MVYCLIYPDVQVYLCDKCNSGESEVESTMVSRGLPLRSRSTTALTSVVTRAHKQMKVTKLPKILRLHLKRFRWMGGGSHRDKIGIHVQFDEMLDMAPFCVDNSRATRTQYRLCGVIIHHGRGFNCGHYTSYCWHSVGRWVQILKKI